MTVKKSADMSTSPPNSKVTINEELEKATEMAIKEYEDDTIEREKESVTSKGRAKKVPKLTDITVDNLKVLISEVVAAELEKWSHQLTITTKPESKDLDNSARKKPYLNSEGEYILLERTPEQIAKQAQSIRDMFTEWEREYDAEEQRETFAYLQKALRDDFPSEGLFSENPLSVSQ